MNDDVEKWGTGFVAVGGLGIVATSAMYLLSPEAAVVPVVASRYGEAFAQAQGLGTTAWLAGTFGLPADVLFAAGAVALAFAALRGGRAPEGLGWLMGALSAVLFIFIDGVTGRVLQVAASEPRVFAAVKSLFDMLWVVGTFGFGLAGICIFFGRRRELLPALCLVAGGIATAASVACLLGADAGKPLGLGVTLGSITFTAWAFATWWRAAPRQTVPA